MYSERLKDIVRQTCREYGIFEGGGTVLAAVSGGADSMCMLHVLCALRAEFGIEVAVAHLDHGVRGAAAEQDAEFVADYAAWTGLRAFIGRIGEDVAAPNGELSPEAGLRKARHEFLRRVANECGATRIAIAHNSDDRVETVLLRIIRGTSPAGLSGMRPVNDMIVRPLFDVNRALIEAYCRENEIEFRNDETNNEYEYLRNRVRHRLLPMLSAEFNPSVKDRIINLSELAAADDAFFNTFVEEILEATEPEEGSRREFDVMTLRRMPVPILSRVLLAGAVETAGDAAGRINAVHIRAAVAAVMAGSAGKEITLPGGVVFSVGYESAWFNKQATANKKREEIAVSIQETPSEISLENTGARMRFDRVEFNRSMLSNPDPSTAFLNYDEAMKLGSPTVRFPRNGDRFAPLGMGGATRRLSDLFTDEKIDRGERGEVPLVVFGDEIVWVAGFRISERVKLAEGHSGDVLRIEML